MPHITLDSSPLRVQLVESLHLPRVGKVRDTYRLPGKWHNLPNALPIVSHRASIFDFRLGFLIPGKGEILNAFNIAARLYRRIADPASQDDLLAYGPDIDHFLPVKLRGNPELHQCATVVHVLTMEDIECVVRGHAVGNLMKAYKKGKKGKRTYCGHLLPEGLIKGAKLQEPLFTPTTKAKVGHDKPLNYRKVRESHGIELEETALRDFELFAGYSLGRGVIGADSKCEYGRRRLANGKLGDLVLGDEAWTPDCTRFWSLAEYEACFPARLPAPMDKQALRIWGIEMGIDKLDPTNPEHVARVRSMVAPASVIEDYLKQMRRAFKMLWGQSLGDFQKSVMNIR
jgi:phosphoribosylaminoimidazole-succinocarboxamide synthase